MPAALVTGAGRRGNVAAAVVPALEREGWDVATTDLEGEVTVRADLGDPEAAAGVFEATEAAVGGVTALVNCHAHSELGGLLEATPEQFDRHMVVNARATLLLSAEFVRRFGGEPGLGRIVNFTSTPPLAGEIAYAASKGAIEWITISAAVELGPRGITVNAVDPGPTETGWMSEELAQAVAQATPLGRAGRPQDAAELVAFLVSPAAGWITGQILHSDGGYGWVRRARRGGTLDH
jgi:3-oxoacyl-[acyl-carrier protein] reductase